MVRTNVRGYEEERRHSAGLGRANGTNLRNRQRNIQDTACAVMSLA